MMRTLSHAEPGMRPGLDPARLSGAVMDPAVREAFASVQRPLHLPEERRMVAGLDIEIPIGPGRRCPRPSALARVIEAARVPEGGSVMVVGAAGGYPVALLLAMGAGSIVAVERNPALLALARQSIAHPGVRFRPDVPAGDGQRGERFDAIVFGGSVPAMPRDLIALLGPRGRMAVVIRQHPEPELVLVVRDARGHTRRDLGAIDMPPLPPWLNG